MSHRVFALVIENELRPMDSLKEALRDVSVDTSTVSSCEEAMRLLAQTEPHMIFTTTSVADGSWLDVILLAEKAGIPSNVIVVAQTSDVRLCLSALDAGAFEFMVPPFERVPLGHIVRSAWLDVQNRRKARALLAEV
jgi:DNA-binding NtrC family response regulator